MYLILVNGNLSHTTTLQDGAAEDVAEGLALGLLGIGFHPATVAAIGDLIRDNVE